MITPWDGSLDFSFAQQCEGRKFNLECETCGDPASWELFYTGSGCPSEERYLCNLHWQEENMK